MDPRRLGGSLVVAGGVLIGIGLLIGIAYVSTLVAGYFLPKQIDESARVLVFCFFLSLGYAAVSVASWIVRMRRRK